MRNMMLRQVSEQLKILRLALVDYSQPPAKGWIRTIRQALGMTTIQLAKRLNVNQSRVVHIEKAEVNEAITLRTLKATAEALECKLVYAFVPQSTLENMLKQRAIKIAKKRVARTYHNMVLEEQAPNEKELSSQIEELTKKILENENPKILWDDE